MDIIDKTIDRYILENNLLGKVPTTRQLEEKRAQHKHNWHDGAKFFHNGRLFIRCAQSDCPVIKSAFSSSTQDTSKPKRKANNMKWSIN